jgi:MFS family permease
MAGLSQVLRIPEFRALWVAETLSVAGDQLARVALAVLVYHRSGSAAWSAVTYALTFLPAMLGGLLLGGLADRYPRRTVMVVADLLRMVFLAAMAVSGVPLWLLAGLLVLAVLLAAPHSAAQGALLPAVLPDKQYEHGLAVRQITIQAAQIAGFAAGGVAVAALGPSTALALDAATFALSAAVVWFGVHARPAPIAAAPRPGSRWSREAFAGLRVVLTDRRRRTLALLAWLVGCYVVP